MTSKCRVNTVAQLQEEYWIMLDLWLGGYSIVLGSQRDVCSGFLGVVGTQNVGLLFPVIMSQPLSYWGQNMGKFFSSSWLFSGHMFRYAVHNCIPDQPMHSLLSMLIFHLCIQYSLMHPYCRHNKIANCVSAKKPSYQASKLPFRFKEKQNSAPSFQILNQFVVSYCYAHMSF